MSLSASNHFRKETSLHKHFIYGVYAGLVFVPIYNFLACHRDIADAHQIRVRRKNVTIEGRLMPENAARVEKAELTK